MKFEAEPGDRVLVSDEDPTMLLVYDGIPDWVRLPPDLGGQRVDVKHGIRGDCPCGEHETLILVLDEPTGIRVAECPVRGYLWHRLKEGGER